MNQQLPPPDYTYKPEYAPRALASGWVEFWYPFRDTPLRLRLRRADVVGAGETSQPSVCRLALHRTSDPRTPLLVFGSLDDVHAAIAREAT